MILKKISKLCEERKISISKLEKECGIGNGTIGRWKDSTPTVDKLKKVADYFGVTLDELLEESEQKGA